MIEDCYKTSIPPTAIHLKTADGSPMSMMGKVTLPPSHCQFKFLHTFNICDKLPETHFPFSINLQKRYLLSYCWDLDRQLLIQREASFLTYTRNSEQHHNITVMKSTMKIPPRHNGTIPIKIKRHDLRAHMVYFISNQHITKGLDPKHPCN